MTTDTRQETRGFQAEVRQLLDLMIHSLYSNREIFLRELISNASDAIDKLRFEALQDDSLYEDDADFRIRVEYDRNEKTITVTDNGIGMSREEAAEHLGTIARSGTREFFQSLTGDQSHDARLIGQFGVGFYSSFIVAGKVEVLTRRAGQARTEGVRWTSTGEGEYTLETVDRPRRGTRVVLYLRDDAAEFLDGFRLREIIRRYSDHIPQPIVMPAEGKDAGGDETINTATALWTRNKKDIKDDEYHEFYKHIAHDFQEPLAHIHHKVEGKLEYTSLLFIPARAPFDLWDRQQLHGIKLYVRRVFIRDDTEHLLPPWLRFVRGVVDSDDLPLNISREVLQHNKTIDAIRAGCTKKILGLLKDMSIKDPDKYRRFWKEFGRVLKEGIVDDPEKRRELAKLFRFASTAADSEEQSVSLDYYAGRMQQDQKAIYYITAESYATARNSPHLEIFRQRNIEVLLMSDPIDEWVTTHLNEFDGKPLRSVSKGGLDLDEIPANREKTGEPESAEKLEELVQRIKAALADTVQDVRTTRRLTTSPACLVADEHALGRTLERILKASGQKLPESKPILEINPEHPVMRRLQQESDPGVFADWSMILFEQALLSEGAQLDDPAGFVQRLNSMLLRLSGEKQ